MVLEKYDERSKSMNFASSSAAWLTRCPPHLSRRRETILGLVEV